MLKNRRRTPRSRGVLTALIAMVTMAVIGGGLPALAYEVPTTAATYSSSTKTGTLTAPSGIKTTVKGTGTTTANGATTLGARGYLASQFSQGLPTTTPAVEILTLATNNCASTGVCTGVGTFTMTFDRPVDSPILSIAGVGGNQVNGTTPVSKQSNVHAILTLTTPNVTLSKLSGTNLAIEDGKVITAIEHSAGMNCHNTAYGAGVAAKAVAVCGTVQVEGKVTTLSFDVSMMFTKASTSMPALSCNQLGGSDCSIAVNGDAYQIAVTFPQDYGDAPTSYDQSNAARHVITDLRLGTDVTEDNATVANGTTSQNASDGAAKDVGDDGVTLTTMEPTATTYSTTVALSGASSAGTVCGWLDVNKNGVFATNERACATFAAGATSATLNWTGLTGVKASDTYARFRIGYNATQVQSPTGVADSGEVEDYSFTIAAAPKANPSIALTKSVTPTTVSAKNGSVAYTFRVENTGDTALDSINVTETKFTGTGTKPVISCPVTTLAVGEWTNCTATYALTQADYDAGFVDNTAVAHGTPPGTGATPVDSAPSSAKVTVTPAPSLTLVKSVTPTTVSTSGDSVAYTFAVKNTGNVTLTSVNVTETAFTGKGTKPKVTCLSTTLAPDAETSCTATYRLVQADIDAGFVDNTAVAHGTPPGGTPVDSPPSSAKVTTPNTPTITLTKSVTPTTVTAAGTGVAYSFLVTNTGNVTLSSVNVTESAFTGTGTKPVITCPVTTLAPNASTTCTAAYALTQADIEAGFVDNTAVAHGTPPGGTPVDSPPSSAKVTTPNTPSITLTKSVTPTTVTAAGTGVAYSFLVTNTGNVTLSSVNVTESAFTGTGTKPVITCPVTTLAPNASTTCTAAYALTQADINTGFVDNTAVAHGTPPGGTPVDSSPSSAKVTATPSPALTLTKSASPATITKTGDVVNYTFAVKNTGNMTLSSVNVTESAFTGTGTKPVITCPETTLTPGAETTCTATYAVTQADIDAGAVDNTAVAHGTPPSGTPVDSPPDSAQVTTEGQPSITLAKSVSPTQVTKAGDSVTYTFAVKNTGNVKLTAVDVTESAFTGTGTKPVISCPETVLTAGASMDCTATYKVTQADINAGAVDNTAVAHGTPPGNGAKPVDSPPDSAQVTAPGNPALTLTKTAQPTTAKVGDTVKYTFHAVNTGNVTLNSVNITETAFTGTGTLSTITCPETTLAPGASTDCTATYAVTQADVNAGKVDNTAVAHGTPPGGTPIDSPPDDATVTTPHTPAISLEKSVTPQAVTAAGTEAAYAFTVTNTGNVPLTGVSVEETAFTGSGEMSEITCPATTLAPGASTTCTATYTVTQADVNAGKVDNTAVAHGTPPGGSATPVTSEPDSAQIVATGAPQITLTKKADPAVAAKVGDKITYTFTAKNTGNVDLTKVNITETAFTGSGEISAITCPGTSLAVGQSVDCTATYAITQADMNAGKVDNTAIAHGTPPGTDTPVDSPPASAKVTTTATPTISLTKSANPTVVAKTGDKVTYSFVVTNTGNVDLTKVNVTETAFTGSGELSKVTCPETSLAVGKSTTCTATYTVTQADINAGKVDNTAVAHGTPPGTSTPVDSAPASAKVTSTATPAITLAKTASPATVTKSGDKVTYSFVITNTGNVDLTGVSIEETAFTGFGELSTVDCPDTAVGTGKSVTCTATYTVTQADVNAGVVDNTAVAHATPPGDGTPPIDSPPASAKVTVPATAAITLAKSASPATVAKSGDKVTYSFVVTNTGNVDLTKINVEETAFTGSGKISEISCPETTLASGKSVTCTATYAVTQADVNAGVVDNTAVAHGTPPGSETPVDSAPASAKVTVPAVPAITLVKSANPATVAKTGDKVTYSFVVTNTGNVDLTKINVKETAFTGSGKISEISCPETTLAVGKSTTCTATYAFTQADVNAGHVDNTAVAHGTPPGTQTPVNSAPASAKVTVPAVPAITLVKSASPTAVTKSGDKVTYSFVVTNTGNVDLTKVGVLETVFTGSGKISAIDCPAATLAVGKSTTCTATYTFTQADVNAGKVDNTAVAHGTPPGDGAKPVDSAPSSAKVTVESMPAITLAKSANPSQVTKAGDKVAYSFVVTNAGNVDLTKVGVLETAFTGSGKISAIECPETALAVGKSTTCTATYALTQADVNAGKVDNTAVAHGTPPATDTPVESMPASAQVLAPSGPAITLAKSAEPTAVTKSGDKVTYSFVVTNTGNVDLTKVNVSETAFTGSGKISAIDCPAATLAVGKSTTCTATYAVTQADVNAGKVDNTAIAYGTPPATDTPVDSMPASAQVLVPSGPAITLTKSADPASVTKAGDKVTYSFVVTNAGNVDLTKVNVSETAFTGSGKISAIECQETALAVGKSTTCTATYAITQADVNKGSVDNTAVAHGTPPGDGAKPVESMPASAQVLAPSGPAITLAKSADPTSVTKAGDKVAYSFVVTNTGNVDLTKVNVTETAFTGSGKISAITCPETTLAVGKSTTCTATYAVTQADVNAGKVDNTAVAHGTPPGDGAKPVDSMPASAQVLAQAGPAITLAKSADPASVTKAGDEVTYSFVVTNTGNVDLTKVGVTETEFTGSGKISAIKCPETALGVGKSTTCTATYAITQADVNKGSVDNTAVAHGTPPDSDTPVDSMPASARVTALASPAIALTKSADPTSVTKEGDEVTYSFVVTNTGNVDLTKVNVTETAFTGTGKISAITCPDTALAAGKSTTCTATYAATQADVNAGTVDNTAVAHGTPPGSDTPVDSMPASARITALGSPALTLAKTADPTQVTKEGATVTYSFVVTNTGNVDLTKVNVTETAFTGTGKISAITCPDTALAAGKSTTCTATYAATQADVNAGTVDNTAVAHGTPPGSDTPVDSMPASARVVAPSGPAITLAKSANPATVSKAGDKVTYSFVVTNTGNVDLTKVNVTETAFTGTGKISAIDCPETELAVGKSTTCTATYAATQADVNAGKVDNTAVAHGTPPGSQMPVDSAPASARVTVPAVPAITLAKAADPTTVAKAGDKVAYSFVVTNTGNVDLTKVNVTETAFTGTGKLSDVTCPDTALAVGKSTTCTATYAVTQADINAGHVDNTAVAHGTPPGAETPVDSAPASAKVTVMHAPSVTLAKTASPTTVAKTGDKVTYSFVVTNTGNVDLTKVSVEETAFTGSGKLSDVTCPETALAVGKSTTCTATYAVTQADINAGHVDNTAVAHGTPPGAETPVDSAPASAKVTSTAVPAITLTKSADPTTVTKAGDKVTYSFAVTNTGNVDLTKVGVEETAFTGTGKMSQVTCPETTLAAGKSTTCTATYVFTQADVNAGHVDNTAVAHGTPPGDDAEPVGSAPASARVTVPAVPTITLTKSANPTTAATAGDKVTYTFVVTNTGNVDLSKVNVEETAFTGSGKLSAIDCPQTSLAVGKTLTCTATYAITQADVNAGHVDNTAVAHGTPPGAETPVDSAPASAKVTVPAVPAITLTKSASPTAVTKADDKVTYSFVVTNTGNVDLTKVNVEETAFTGTGKLSDIDCPDTALTVGKSTTCTATYAVTDADINAEKIDNTAIAHGTPPGDSDPIDSAPASARVIAEVIPDAPVVGISLTKTADPTTVSKAGDQVTYTFAVTNTGEADLTGVTIEEKAFTGSGKLSSITCPQATLAAGKTMDCTATYAFTQADINAGKVTNTAVAHGTPPGSETPVSSEEATAEVVAAPGAAISLVKSADPTTITTAGDQVTYTFAVTNTGNVDLTGVTIEEKEFTGTAKMSAVTCAATDLAVGKSLHCTATYTATQADIHAGKVTNTAVAHGTTPAGTPVTSPEASAQVTAPAAPVITLEKSAQPGTVAKAGDQVTYTFAVRNAGNTDLTDVRIEEKEFTGTGQLGAITCADTVLAVGASTTCTATYAITADDVNTGKVTNTAVAHGTPATGGTVASVPASAEVVATPGPAIALAKSVAPATVTRAGDQVTYSFTVTNTGTVDLKEIRIEETAFTGSGKLSAINCPTETLKVGKSATCTATYQTTAKDITAMVVNNTAVAHAVTTRPAAGTPVTSAPSSAKVVVPGAPSLSLVKSANPTAMTKAGQNVTYTFAVTNTGNVPVKALTINERSFTGAGKLPAAACPKQVLAAGETTSCTATYTVTQADINASQINNTATATGTGPGDVPVVSPPSSAQVLAHQAPVLTLVKSADKTSVTKAGEMVTYSFAVANTGNVDLTKVSIEETEFTGTGTLSDVVCPGTGLAAGKSMTCTATYQVTEADLAASGVRNTAVANAMNGTTPVKSGPSAAVLTVPAVPDAPTPAPLTPAAAVLAFTGSNAVPLAGGALLLLVAGTVLITARRRRADRQ